MILRIVLVFVAWITVGISFGREIVVLMPNTGSLLADASVQSRKIGTRRMVRQKVIERVVQQAAEGSRPRLVATCTVLPLAGGGVPLARSSRASSSWFADAAEV